MIVPWKRCPWFFFLQMGITNCTAGSDYCSPTAAPPRNGLDGIWPCGVFPLSPREKFGPWTGSSIRRNNDGYPRGAPTRLPFLFFFLGSRHASTDLVDGMRRKRLRIVSRWLISSLFSIYATQSSSDSDSDIAVSHDASSWNSDSLVVIMVETLVTRYQAALCLLRLLIPWVVCCRLCADRNYFVVPSTVFLIHFVGEAPKLTGDEGRRSFSSTPFTFLLVVLGSFAPIVKQGYGV